jgi:hypothetical protein
MVQMVDICLTSTRPQVQAPIPSSPKQNKTKKGKTNKKEKNRKMLKMCYVRTLRKDSSAET